MTAACTPSSSLIDGFVETFDAGNPIDLLRAIERARLLEPPACAAAALAQRHSWDAALTAELEDLERLASEPR